MAEGGRDVVKSPSWAPPAAPGIWKIPIERHGGNSFLPPQLLSCTPQLIVFGSLLLPNSSLCSPVPSMHPAGSVDPGAVTSERELPPPGAPAGAAVVAQRFRLPCAPPGLSGCSLDPFVL